MMWVRLQRKDHERKGDDHGSDSVTGPRPTRKPNPNRQTEDTGRSRSRSRFGSVLGRGSVSSVGVADLELQSVAQGHSLRRAGVHLGKLYIHGQTDEARVVRDGK